MFFHASALPRVTGHLKLGPKQHLIIRAGLVIKGFCCLSFYGFGAFLNQAEGTVLALHALMKKIFTFIFSGDANMYYVSVC